MTDAVESEQVQAEEAQGQQETTEQGGDAAPYGPQSILDQLDEFSQQKIRDSLFEMEKNATSRIESVNDQYKPWKTFADQGYTPDQMTSLISMVTELNNDPKAFYDRMGQYLQQNGLLATPENVQKAAEAVSEGTEGQGSTETDSETEKLRKELLSRLEQIEQREQQTQNEQRYNQQVDQLVPRIQVEVNTVKQAHPEYSDGDFREIARIVETENSRLAQAGRQNEVFSFTQAAQYYETEIRQRILSTPRPGQTAPKLVPTGGNVAVETESRKPSEIGSREFSKDAADWIASLNQK